MANIGLRVLSFFMVSVVDVVTSCTIVLGKLSLIINIFVTYFAFMFLGKY